MVPNFSDFFQCKLTVLSDVCACYHHHMSIWVLMNPVTCCILHSNPPSPTQLLYLCHLYSDTVLTTTFYFEKPSSTMLPALQHLRHYAALKNANATCPSLKDLGDFFHVPSQLFVNQRFYIPLFFFFFFYFILSLPSPSPCAIWLKLCMCVSYV